MSRMVVLILVVIVFAGTVVCNSDQTVFGFPLFFVWNLFSVFLIAGGMCLIFRLDPRNREKS
jgi:hypothetical protein